MERKINLQSVYRIFYDYGVVLEKKKILSELAAKKYLSQVTRFLKTRDVDAFISILRRTISANKDFYNAVHDLLPVIFYAAPDKRALKKCARDFGFDVSFASIDPFDPDVVFEKYAAHPLPPAPDSKFSFFLQNILFQHTNISGLYRSLFRNVLESGNIDPRLATFVYPNKYWERFDEYLGLLAGDGDGHAVATENPDTIQSVKQHYQPMHIVLYVISNIYSNNEWFGLLKKYFFFVYINRDTLFLDFDAVISTFKRYFARIRLVFPLRTQFMRFLYFCKKLDHDTQMRFLAKILFLEMCPICNSYTTVQDFYCHFDRNKRTAGYNHLAGRIPENYYTFHFIACSQCIKSWRKMGM